MDVRKGWKCNGAEDGVNSLTLRRGEMRVYAMTYEFTAPSKPSLMYNVKLSISAVIAGS